MNSLDLASAVIAFGDMFLVVAVVGCIFTLIEIAAVLGFTGSKPARTAATPSVTVLKPLHGAEPDLAGRLAAFCEQDYPGPVQVVFGAHNSAAGAIAAARQVKAAYPDRQIDLVVESRSHGTNRKVSNLVNMMSCARHDVVVLSDSDIVAGPGYLRAVTALLAPAEIGAVTCLYHGIADGGLWARLSALAVNSHFLPQALTAATFGLAQPCCGATLALRRSLLDRIGGFRAFADALADDYVLGGAVRSLGYEIGIAPFVVGHRCFETSLRQLFRHEMRVARTIRAVDPVGHAGTLISHPWPLALLGMFSGSTTALLVMAAALACRVTLCRLIEQRFGLPRQDHWLIPLQDVIAFAVYVASFFRATVHWRGSEYRVAADGTLIEDKP